MATMYVYNIPTNETVNLRSSRDTSVSNVLVRVPYGAAVSATAYDSTWHSASYSGYSGYIMSMYLTATNPNGGGGSGFPSDVNQNSKKSGYIATQTDPLTIRSGPGTGYGSVGSVPRNATVDYYTTSLSTSWYYVVYGSIKGYGSAQYILPSSGGGTTPPSGSDFYQATVAKTGVNIRKAADTNASTWGQIDQNRRIIVKPYNNDWYITFWGNNPGSTAYIKADCVTLGTKNNDLRLRVLWLVPHFLGKKKWYFGGDLANQTGGLTNDWCMSFCNWIYTAAGGTTSTAPLNDSNAATSWTWFGNNNRKKTTPTEGDVIFYKWTGSTKNVDHAGLVYYVSGSTIKTYEGNRGPTAADKEKVQDLSTTTADTQILGYGKPY